jgi:SAM-dependent methyltransferase
MTDPLFISSPVNVLTGDAARVALETTNDAAYLTPGKGVLSVPLERWQQAQAYERETWLTHGIAATEDRNTEHAGMFDGYAKVPKNLGAVIELGCGAFTNLRHILPGRDAARVILLDPLLSDYQQFHPNCTYRLGKICDHFFDRLMFSIEEYADMSLNDLALHGLHEQEFNEYDTVVMVNVLSHCQDALKVFDWIKTHLKKGGHLIFGEPVRDIDVTKLWDVGHPLSYNQSVIDDFLKGYKSKYRNGNYFIGVKK